MLPYWLYAIVSVFSAAIACAFSAAGGWFAARAQNQENERKLRKVAVAARHSLMLCRGPFPFPLPRDRPASDEENERYYLWTGWLAREHRSATLDLHDALEDAGFRCFIGADLERKWMREAEEREAPRRRALGFPVEMQ